MRRRDLLRGLGTGILATGSTVAYPGTTGTPTDPHSTRRGTGVPPLAWLDIPGAAEAVVGPDGTTAFVATHDGFTAIDVADPAAPNVLAEVRDVLADRDQGPLRDVQDLAVDGTRLLVVGPAHRQRDSLRAAALFDVSDPATPDLVAAVETEFPIHNCDLTGTTAYLTGNDGDRNPLVIVDMTIGEEVARWSPLDAHAAWRRVPAPLRPLHDVTVRGEMAYCSYWDAGTWLVDVTDPSAPRGEGRAGGLDAEELASLADRAEIRREATTRPGNHHSAATDPAGTVLAVGKESWAIDGRGGPDGIDLYALEPAPRHAATIEPLPAEDTSRGGVWTTAHNFTIHDGYLYSAWYQGGLRVHDIRDPADPVEIAAWRDPDRARLWSADRARDAVIASSMGVDDTPGALLTFPLPDAARTASSTESAPTDLIAAAVAGLAGAAWIAYRRRWR